MQSTRWHHGPEHRFERGRVYMITGATLYKQHFFYNSLRLRSLQQIAFDFAHKGRWCLRSWSFFSNHYHLIAKPLSGSLTLSRFVQGIHSKSARELNNIDEKAGRRIWFQYWDRCLTIESSYYARLNYVNSNPVHHGLVPVASHYPFSSAWLYEASLSPARHRKLRSYKYEAVKESDDFEPVFVVESGHRERAYAESLLSAR
jgi:putative transposase